MTAQPGSDLSDPQKAEAQSQAAPRHRPASLWHDRNFRKLWMGETLSQTGSQVTVIAFPLIAVLTLNAGAGTVGLLTTAQYLPILLISLFAGSWVDRHSIRLTMAVCHFARAALVVVIPISYAAGLLRVELLYADAFAVGAFTALFDVAYVSYVPRLVPREQIPEANAKLESTYSIAEAAGPGIGGMLVQGLGAPVAPLADAATYAVAGGLACALRLPPQRRDVSVPAPERSVWRDATLSLKLIWSDRILRPLVVQSAAFNLLGLVAYTLFLVLGVQTLHLSAGVLGWILASASVGALLGATRATALGRRFGVGRTLVWGMTVGSLGLVFVPAAGGPTALVVSLLTFGFVIHGIGLGLFNVHSLNVRAERIAPEHAGRITGGWRLLSNGAIPLNGLLASGLGVLVGPRWAIAISVTLLAGCCLGLLRSRVRTYVGGTPVSAAGTREQADRA